MENGKIVLNDAFKRFTLDQDKVMTPEETVRRFKEKLKNLDMDILERTVRIDNGRLGIPVYFSMCGKDAASVIGTKKQMGKGASTAQAEASAVMELAERFSFFNFCNDPKNFFIEKHRNLADRAISFELIAQSVHDASNDLAISKNIFQNLPLKWTRAFSLTRNEPVLIPFNWFFTINEFNGPSAGNCVEEALSQGICEIIERHVSSQVNRNKIQVPLIDPDSATQPLVREMIQKFKNTGIQLFLSDFTLDTGIPTVGALAYDPTTFPAKSEIVWTAGTTPDPQKALSRALTEVAQLGGDFNTSANYVASGLPKFKTLTETQFITSPGKHTDIGKLPDLSNDNIKIEVQNLISTLASKKMEVIVVNTTHPLLEVPAFYTIIPGAHFRERAIGTSVAMFAAKIIAESENPDVAVVELNKLDRMLPGKYYIKFYIGSCHLSLGDPETALLFYHQALDLEPTGQDIPSIYSYIGQSLKNMEKYEEAIDALQTGATYDAERTDIFNLLGFCYFKLKKYNEAIEHFKKVLRINPSSAIDYANIASNYRDMGEKEKAIRYYDMALTIDPTIEFARENLMRLTKTK
ncbi:YcaO-like family protein [Thermodesulfobacteriota bacterium]